MQRRTLVVLLTAGALVACPRPQGVAPSNQPSSTSLAAADSIEGAWDKETLMAEDLPPDSLAAMLQSLGYSPAEARSAAVVSLASSSPDRFWQTRNHLYGYLPPRVAGDSGTTSLTNAFDLDTSDETLSGTPMRLTIDRVKVKKYPGKGLHHIAFFCSVRTQVASDVDIVRYSVGYTAREGDEVAAVGITMFDGAKISNSYLNLKCNTTNVDTKKDKTFFSILSRNAFSQGLQLLSTAQPALEPLSTLIEGVKNDLEGQRKGIVVQDFEIGLDLAQTSTRIKLREGSYIVVQIPPAEAGAWKWEDWEFSGGRFRKKNDPTSLIEYNYIVVGVSKTAAKPE